MRFSASLLPLAGLLAQILHAQAKDIQVCTQVTKQYVTNGDFATDSDWTSSQDYTIVTKTETDSGYIEVPFEDNDGQTVTLFQQSVSHTNIGPFYQMDFYWNMITDDDSVTCTLGVRALGPDDSFAPWVTDGYLKVSAGESGWTNVLGQWQATETDITLQWQVTCSGGSGTVQFKDISYKGPEIVCTSQCAASTLRTSGELIADGDLTDNFYDTWDTDGVGYAVDDDAPGGGQCIFIPGEYSWYEMNQTIADAQAGQTYHASAMWRLKSSYADADNFPTCTFDIRVINLDNEVLLDLAHMTYSLTASDSGWMSLNGTWNATVSSAIVNVYTQCTADDYEYYPDIEIADIHLRFETVVCATPSSSAVASSTPLRSSASSIPFVRSTSVSRSVSGSSTPVSRSVSSSSIPVSTPYSTTLSVSRSISGSSTPLSRPVSSSSIPVSTPYSTPLRVPTTIPISIPQSTPVSHSVTPHSIPVSSPYSIPIIGPTTIPNSIRQSTSVSSVSVSSASSSFAVTGSISVPVASSSGSGSFGSGSSGSGSSSSGSGSSGSGSSSSGSGSSGSGSSGSGSSGSGSSGSGSSGSGSSGSGSSGSGSSGSGSSGSGSSGSGSSGSGSSGSGSSGFSGSSASVSATSTSAPDLTTFNSDSRSTTSTIFTTQTSTVTACPSTVTNCPVTAKTTYVTTETILVSTTVCPVTAAQVAHPTTASIADNGSYTSTILSTRTITVTSCAATVTNCPARSQTTYTSIQTLVAGTTVISAGTSPTVPSSIPFETALGNTESSSSSYEYAGTASATDSITSDKTSFTEPTNLPMGNTGSDSTYAESISGENSERVSTQYAFETITGAMAVATGSHVGSGASPVIASGTMPVSAASNGSTGTVGVSSSASHASNSIKVPSASSTLATVASATEYSSMTATSAPVWNDAVSLSVHSGLLAMIAWGLAVMLL
ncbi:hypothetical protein N7520_002157 [Penicillium odoratum]|uniref:uncharacterized protein n=1 Tax=Penicillium odoratum TaxID=1167516 RepID=UPI002547F425|nr:uncharacterized protein N7520_002157 [Penicillium odoratum]KAJ5771628.1 hypothetical protein N7520_002157 [Penicillium odoratum]